MLALQLRTAQMGTAEAAELLGVPESRIADLRAKKSDAYASAGQ